MGGNAPFHVQLDEHLRRQFWTARDLIDALRSPNGRRSARWASRDLEVELSEVLAGRLAPTERFGELIANVVIGAVDGLDATDRRLRDELIGAAYVAECHGRRQQPPYTHGVIGEPSRSNSALTVDQSESRQEKVNEQQRQQLSGRLIELEEKQALRRSRHAGQNENAARKTKWTSKPRSGAKQCRDLGSAEAQRAKWNEAATVSLQYIPHQAHREDADREESFLHVVERSFQAGYRFPQFLESLLLAWRSEIRSRRGRYQTRMSPEQLGVAVGERNHERYAKSRQMQDWFRVHKGVSVTGNALRNYLDGSSERPLSECLQKLVWSFAPDDAIQLDVERKLWRMANAEYPLHPSSAHELLEWFESDWDHPQTWRRARRRFPSLSKTTNHARGIWVSIGEEPVPFNALADDSGFLFSPLCNPKTKRMVVGVAQVSPEDGALRTAVDVALSQGKRNLLMRVLVEQSGMPITRIAELGEVHESLFQQWMREGPNRRIEDRNRAARVVNLLNPPHLARWPMTQERVVKQNDWAVNLLTSDTTSLDEALTATSSCRIPEKYQLDREGQKTFRAAFLLRQVFGRESLSNLTGPQVGRRLADAGLGDEQTFKHLREGVREAGRKSARRATLDQARFLVGLLEETLGDVDRQERNRFLGCVACVELDALGNLPTSVQLLRQAEDPKSNLTVRKMTKEMMRRRGGLVRFSRDVRVSQQSIRHFVTDENHFLHHPVARRIAARGLGFARGSEEYRRFVILSTAAWKQRDRSACVRLSKLYSDYSQRLSDASTKLQARRIRAAAMGSLLSQAALSPKELAKSLQVSTAVLAGWTTPRIGHFTSQKALDRFTKLAGYEAEQVSFVQEAFGPKTAVAPRR